MNDILLHIQIFDKKMIHHVWVRETTLVQDFIHDIKSSWNLSHTSFEHFFYHLEAHRVLDSDQTFRNNEVLSGDHCILI